MNSSNSNANNSNNLGMNFELPSIPLDFSSLSQALNPRNFNLGSNIDELMAFTNKFRSKDVNNGCDSCGNKFGFLKRKRTCTDCGMDFCNGCLIKDNGSDRKNHCKRCRVFNSVPLDRNALLGLRARDLKWFLSSKRIPSQMHNEKGELVDLIIQSLSPQTNASNSSATENVRRLDNYSTSYSREPQREPQTDPQTDQNEGSSSDNPSDTFTPNPSINPINLSQVRENNSQLYPDVSQITNETEVETEANTQPINARFNIDDLKSVEQLKELSVQQLKLILTRNFIDYKGCVEKRELVTKVLRLWNVRQENKQQNIDEIPDANICKICMESSIDCVLLECGHMVSCTDCGKRLNECPICRQYVIRVVHTFKA